MPFGVIFLRLVPTQPTLQMVFKETKKKKNSSCPHIRKAAIYDEMA